MSKRVIFFIVTFAIFSYLFIDKELATYFMANKPLHSFFKFATSFGNSKYYIIFSLLLFIYFWCRDNNKKIERLSLLIFSSVVVSGLIVIFIKIIVARYRPAMLMKSGDFGFSWFDISYIVNSFPSGHSATAFSLFVALALVYTKLRKALLLIASIVAFSRVALGVHYFSDILIGSLTGALTSIYYYNKIYKGKS